MDQPQKDRLKDGWKVTKRADGAAKQSSMMGKKYTRKEME